MLASIIAAIGLAALVLGVLFFILSVVLLDEGTKPGKLRTWSYWCFAVMAISFVILHFD